MEKYNSLIDLMLKKELIHYKRMKELFYELDTVGGKLISFPIITFLVTISHYCFASMHFLFETYCYLFDKNQFEKNMLSSHKKINKIILLKINNLKQKQYVKL